MSLEFNHAGIVVSDIDASTHFYRDLLGFEVVTSYKLPHPEVARRRHRGRPS
jgi:catechol 2,3-dioxygenase-like lactoylglutathione lyase family enzyme